MKVVRGDAEACISGFPYSNDISFGSFHCREKSCGKGHGKAVLKAVCALADALSLPVRLGVGPFSHATLTRERLIAYYRRFGFRLKRGTRGYMVRPAVLQITHVKAKQE